MVTVRSTMQPWLDIGVTEDDRWLMIQQGVLATWPGYLVAEFAWYEGAPLTEVSGVTITITDEADAVVLGPASAGISNPGTGIYHYSWYGIDEADAGDYTVTWDAADYLGNSVQAVETVTVS